MSIQGTLPKDVPEEIARYVRENLNPHDHEVNGPHMRTYITKKRVLRVAPSIELIEELEEEGLGFCTACGAQDQPIEPDAFNEKCDCCGEPKLFGAVELALRGISF